MVTLSPILYASCVNSGEYPKSINIGIKTGAIIAHLADALFVEVHDLMGRKINVSVEDFSEKTYQLNTSVLKQGIYLIKASDGIQTITRKFQKVY